MSFLCVDGGQTKTDVLLLDEGGTEIHAWQAGPLTTPWKPGALEDLRGVVRGIAEELGRRLEASSVGPPAAACFSLTGYVEGDERISSLVREELERAAPEIGRIHTVPDYVGNWAAATGGRPGIIVISGGGSVAYGRAASGDSLRVGGWGHLLGDEGSGFWIGLEAIKAALKSRAGVIPKTGLEEGVMQAFGTTDERRIVREVYSAAFSGSQVAGLVPLVVSVAQDGDETAARLLDEAADHLAGIARAVLDALGDLRVYPSGGVFRAPTVRERFVGALARSKPGVEVADSAVPNPLDGAFLIAREGLG